jgi:hypothetical protein
MNRSESVRPRAVHWPVAWYPRLSDLTDRVHTQVDARDVTGRTPDGLEAMERLHSSDPRFNTHWGIVDGVRVPLRTSLHAYRRVTHS